MIKQYRKKPVVVEAVQFTDNYQEIIAWSNGAVQTTPYATVLKIETLEGTMEAHVGDYIIKGIADEFYPCAPDIFNKTYEEEK